MIKRHIFILNIAKYTNPVPCHLVKGIEVKDDAFVKYIIFILQVKKAKYLILVPVTKERSIF